MAHIRRLFRNDAKLKIVATNIRDGEKLSLHPPKFAPSIAQAVRANLEARFPDGYVTPADYLVEFETVCFGDLPARAGSPYLLKAEAGGEPALASPADSETWYTTVIKVEHWQRYIDRETLDALSGKAGIDLPFLPMGGSMDSALVELLKVVRTGSFMPRIGFSLGYPLVWITPRKAFDALMRTSDSKAGAARDHLGLVHHRANVHLIALHIPASAIRLVESSRPTFADAGQHRRFLVACNEHPPPYAPIWGQTLDLAEFEDKGALASGGAERVCARIEARHLAGQAIEFDYLGKLRSSRGVGDATDHAFADKQLERDQVGFSQTVNRI